MSKHRALRPAAGLAVVLGLALVGQVLAITWGPTVRVTPATNANMLRGGLGGSGSTLHLVYRHLDPDGLIVVYRRSTNDGATWSPEVELSRPSADYSAAPTLSVVGSTIDVLWIEGDGTSGSARLYYRRSTNGGAGWTTPVALSPATGRAGFPDVVRSGSTVLVTYTDWATGGVYVRRSVDGGVNWLARIKVGSTTRIHPALPGDQLEGLPSVAAGTGVMYAVWMGSDSTVSLRRSLDGGATWTARTSLETKGDSPAVVAASGSSAMVTFGYFDGMSNSYAAIVRSSDKGAHWTTRAKLSGGTNPAGAWDVIRAGGKWRTVHGRCLAASCATGVSLWYRDSADGVTWSTATRFSNSAARPWPAWASLAYTPTDGRVYIGWSAAATADAQLDIYVRGGD